MSAKTDAENIAKDTIQSVTGTPPDQLRGLTVQSAFNDFIASQSATPIVATSPTPAPEITSNTITFPSASIPTNEQPLTPPVSAGDGGGAGTITNVILNVNGTFYYSDITGTLGSPV